MFNPYMETSHCRFDTWAPDHHTDINNTAFSMYACHTEEMEAVIEKLSKEPDPNDYYAQQRVFDECNVKLEWFTDQERAYIENEVARRWALQ